MDSSFFEYRDKTGVESDSETEVIDSSLVVDDSFKAKKKFPIKNQTVFVAESEDSGSGDETEEYDEEEQTLPKSVLRRSNVAESHIISSSEDDASKRESITHQSAMETSTNNVVSSSSDEAEASPEILPKRRPPMRKSIQSNKLDTSIIGRKKNKRMILMDSDTENSIVIEHDKHKKLICLKDTPLKIDDGNKAENRKASLDVSTMDQSDSSEDEKELSRERIQRSSAKKSGRKVDKNDYSQDYDLTSDDDESSDDGNDCTEDDNDEGEAPDNDNANAEASNNTGNEGGNDTDGSEVNESDEGPDEDQMLMSRATRMSIMGVVPKDDSDDSDFILSDEKSRGSSSRNSLSELPDTGISILKTPQKTTPPDADTSKITCSPIESPLHDLTNEFNNSNILQNNTKEKSLKNKVLRNLSNNDASQKPLVLNYNHHNDDDVTFVESQPLMNNVFVVGKENVKVVDDDVTIIDSKPEIIALSSDDEDDVKPEKKSSKPKQESTSGRSKGKESTMSQYLVPASYPNQIVYVKKHVRENELSKLQGLKEDLQNIKYLLENMDVDTLPDGGVKLIERMSSLEQQVRMQGDKVANMVVEPDNPTAADMAKDGFVGKNEKGLTWDDIQKASNAVQPRMFGKQAMTTHFAERNMILERLRGLHESLGSRPPDTQQASAPAALRSTLMPHQLHALAWLRWRETQSPCGGILADDMGLGKTITMISLVVDDKNKMDDGDDNDNDDDYVGKSSSKLARGGTLVVCPASLMQQWGGEVSKHCTPHVLSVCQHHGAARATHPHRLATYDIVLTTYNILQRDSEKNGVLMKILWRRIILDEAHIVRNHKSATSVAVSALRGRRRWCLTGTPVQNKDLDLFALLKFLRCTPFDELTMWKKWIEKSIGAQQRLSTIMSCVLLRRTKLQLQQKGELNCLPERSTHMKEVTLSTEEMNVYQKVLVFSKSLFAQFLHQRAEKEDGVSIPLNGKNNTYDKMHKKMVALQGAKPVKSHEILVLLLRLRQVCCHCGLIAAMLDKDADSNDVIEDPAGQDLLAELNKLSLEDSRNRRKSGNQDEDGEEENVPIQEEGTSVTEAIRSVMSPNNPVFQLDRQSSKIQAVMDCLRQNVFANPGHKAVVVSQWTSVLRLVEKELERERVRSVTLSGNVPVPARPPLIQALNDPKSNVTVMLLSLCAGGVGLNLCGANHLLLLDPHWNPQLEEQAQDRIYRVGQTKDVHIYRFMCVDTVEQTIRKLQQAKLELADNVLTGARNNNASKLTIEDLKMLFNMGQQNDGVPLL